MQRTKALLEAKTCLVTGASSGIGRAIAQAAASAGARLILVGRNPDRLSETLATLPGTGHNLLPTDLADPERYLPEIQAVLDQHKPIDGFVHAAGEELTLPLRMLTAKHYHRLFAINTVAAFELTRLCARPSLVPASGASHVYLASVRASRGQPGNAAYCASKGALVAGMRAIALELAPKNVRINTISPGMVTTPMSDTMFSRLPPDAAASIKAMHPLGLGMPEDVAEFTIFLLSSNARWITGSDLICDGGYSAS